MNGPRASFRLRWALHHSGLLEPVERLASRTGLTALRARRAEQRYAAAREMLRAAGDAIALPSGVRLAVRPDDRRAQVLHINRGCMDIALDALWAHLVDLLRPDLVVDIGANYGDVTLARPYPPGTRLELFEPNPEVAACLERTVLENGFEATVHKIACSERAGQMELWLQAGYSGTSSLEIRAQGIPLPVTVARVDERVQARGVRVCLVKLDVEGHELPALDGMEGLIAQVPVWRCVCEYAHLDAERIAELHRRFEVRLVESYTLALRKSTPDRMAAAIRGEAGPLLKDALLFPRSC